MQAGHQVKAYTRQSLIKRLRKETGAQGHADAMVMSARNHSEMIKQMNLSAHHGGNAIKVRGHLAAKIQRGAGHNVASYNRLRRKYGVR